MLWYWPLYWELLRFVQYHLQSFYVALLLQIFLLGLLLNLFTLPMSFNIQLVGLFPKSCLRVWIGSSFILIIGVFIGVYFVISCASYIKIYIIVRHHQIQIHAQQQAVNSFNIPDSNNLIISKKRALKTFIYFICMIFCYLPYLSYSLLSNTSIVAFDENSSNLVYNVVFLNSSLNPFLYCLCNHEIRTSVVKIIRKIMCRQTEEAD